MSTVLDQCLVLREAKHGQARFYEVQDPGSSKVLYLVALPSGIPIPQPALLKLTPLRSERQIQWFRGDLPTGLSLSHLWASGMMTEHQLVACILELIDALVPAQSVTPALIPSVLTADHIWRTSNETWVLDLAGLALLPDTQLGAGSNTVRAIGELLRHLTGNSTGDMEGTATPLSTEFRFIMMRAVWGGFSSLHDLHRALTDLVSTGEITALSIPPTVAAPVQTPQSPRKPQHPAAHLRSRVTRLAPGVAVVLLLLVIGLGIRSVDFPQVQAGNETQITSNPVVNEKVMVQSKPRPIPITVEAGLTFSDFLSADLEPEERPVRTKQPAEPEAKPQQQPPAPAPPVTPPAESPQPAPEDPLAALDQKTAGDNRIVVRMWGKPIGQAYMFTNPGAPVLSLDAFVGLMQRPIVGKVIGPQQLQLTDGRNTFVTKDFLILDERLWLVLRPELASQLGLRITNYGNGYLDLEPQL